MKLKFNIGDRVSNKNHTITFIVSKIKNNNLYEDDSDEGGQSDIKHGSTSNFKLYPFKFKKGDRVTNKVPHNEYIYKSGKGWESTFYHPGKPVYILPINSKGTVKKQVLYNDGVKNERWAVKWDNHEFIDGGWDHAWDIKDLNLII